MSASKHFDNTFHESELKSIYERHIFKTSAVGIDNRKAPNFAKDADTELSSAVNRIQEGRYKFSFYKEKLISKGALKLPRVLSIPTIRDRIILKALSIVLARTYPNSITKIPQIKIDSLISKLKSDKFDGFIKLDLQSFYPSISHQLISNSLKAKVRRENIRQLIIDAVSVPTVSRGGIEAPNNVLGVPQGLSISNLIAEICMEKFDGKLMVRDDLFYTRYVDDILILCSFEDAEKIYTEVTTNLKAMGLTPHDKNDKNSKSVVGKVDNGFEFLGYKFEGKIIAPKDSSVSNFESKIASVLTAFKYKYALCRTEQQKSDCIATCEWRLNLKLTGCIFEGKRLGWAFYFSQSNDTSKFRHIDAVVGKMIARAGLDGKIKPKHILKTFYETKRMDKASHRYIVNFDTMPVSEKRVLLVSFLGANRIDWLTDDKINELFKKKFRDISKELEADASRES
jgi:RNA-directed DNA polymerase